MSERDLPIQRIFEITDDALQGLLGFHIYVSGAVDSAPEELIRAKCPEGQIEITPDWVRHYDREELLQFMKKSFTPIFYRNLFVAMVGYFDAATDDFIDYLLQIGINCDIRKSDLWSYKNRLEWVFRRVKGCSFEYPNFEIYVHDLCLDADHARRIRNIIVHNRGIINKKYLTDCSPVCDILSNPELEPSFCSFIDTYRKDPTASIPIIINASEFSKSLIFHIRLLHFLHNEIQKQYFGCAEGYNYKEAKKKIEWHRVFSGV
jgi:hypothetical protein